MMIPLINPEQLILLLQNPKLILIDARTGPQAREKYQSLHLRGALFVDLEQELSQKNADTADGGRHPLPDIRTFATFLGKLGIVPGSHIVVYDDKHGANAAARFWWMLRAVGHEKVQVINGGFAAAVEAGFPTSSDEETLAPGNAYSVENWQLPVATLEEVESATQDANFLVVDVREAERYRGEKEPIDLVAGHIPGAINIPFTTNLADNNFFLTPDELKKKYEAALNDKKPAQVIVHCGSGVTACHTLLAMAYAGLGIPSLYVGSWSEWSRNNQPIATEV